MPESMSLTSFRAELEERLEKLALPKDRPVKIWVAASFATLAESRASATVPEPSC